MQQAETPVTLSELPELKNGERFYCGGITPLLVSKSGKPKEVCFHLIIDESDTHKRLNRKFPGGREEAVDYDTEMWIQNLRAQLTRAGFRISEILVIEKEMKEKKSYATVFARTLIREIISETGYVPMKFKFLTGEVQKENQTSGKEDRDFFQLFFLIDELVQPAVDGEECKINDKGLCVVDEIKPNKDFEPLDKSVKNARLSMDHKSIFNPGNLVRSHHYAAKAAIEKLMMNRDFCMVLYG